MAKKATASVSEAAQATARARTSKSPVKAAAQVSGLSQPSPAQRDEPSHQEIAQRAFELYRARGGYDGSDMSDWLRAESELRKLQN